MVSEANQAAPSQVFFAVPCCCLQILLLSCTYPGPRVVSWLVVEHSASAVGSALETNGLAGPPDRKRATSSERLENAL